MYKVRKNYMCYIENIGLMFYCINTLKFGTYREGKIYVYIVIENIDETFYCINTLIFGTYKVRIKIYVIYRKYRFNVLLY